MMSAKKSGLVIPLVLGVMLLGWHVPALADAGIPMIAVAWPIAWVGLIPVVFLEAWIWWRYLRQSKGEMLSFSLLANLATTLIGMPITWGLLFLYELGVMNLVERICAPNFQDCYLLGDHTISYVLGALVSFPWIGPFESFEWPVVVALGLLFICFFFMSWWVEYRIARSRYKESPRPVLRRASLWANAWSYVMLLVGTVAYGLFFSDL